MKMASKKWNFINIITLISLWIFPFTSYGNYDYLKENGYKVPPATDNLLIVLSAEERHVHPSDTWGKEPGGVIEERFKAACGGKPPIQANYKSISGVIHGTILSRSKPNQPKRDYAQSTSNGLQHYAVTELICPGNPPPRFDRNQESNCGPAVSAPSGVISSKSALDHVLQPHPFSPAKSGTVLPQNQVGEENPYATPRIKDAAATVVYSEDPNHPGEKWILLGLEARGSEPMTWCMMNGKANKDNNYLVTASRELHEESAGVIKISNKDLLMNKPSVETTLNKNDPTQIFRQQFTFFVKIPFQSEEVFRKALSRATEREFREMADYRWVKLSDLVSAVSRNPREINPSLDAVNMSGEIENIRLRSIAAIVFRNAIKDGTVHQIK